MIFKVSISEENWKTKYRYKDEDPAGTFKRVARAAAEVERKYGADDEQVNYWAEQFFHMLVKVDENGQAQGLKSTPGGRITANLGTEYKKVTPWNCFIESPVTKATISYTKPVRDKDMINVVIETGDTPDNLSNIFLTLLESAETLKSEGGIGLNFGFIRPRGSLIKGVGIRHPGVVSYMELWDKMSEIIVKGDNDGYVDKVVNHLEDPEYLKRRVEKVMPRKGAMMAILPIWHPDVEEFIRAKQTPGKLTKFNISVLVDDAFMQAVEKDDFYDLHFNGKVYKRVKARDMYDLIMTSTYNRAEPGVVFLDNANRINPLLYLGPETATNPCVTGDTWVHTTQGPRKVKELVGTPFTAIVNGAKFASTEAGFWSTGIKPVYRVKTKKGYQLTLTSNHKLMNDGEWTAVEDLSVGDILNLSNHREVQGWEGEGNFAQGWLLGSLVGDGTFAMKDDGTVKYACLDYWGEDGNALKERALSFMAEQGIEFTGAWEPKGLDKTRIGSYPLAQLAAKFDIVRGNKTVTDKVESASSEFQKGFLQGLLDSDGSVQGGNGGGFSVRLAQSSTQVLYGVQRMLSRLGIASRVYEERRKAGKRSLPDGKGGYADYECNADHELLISRENLWVFQEIVGFGSPNKKKALATKLSSYQRPPARETFTDAIVEIEAVGEQEVYDVTIPGVHEFDANGLRSHNCGEIPGSAGIDAGYRNYAADYLKPYLDDAKDFIMGRTTVCLLGSVNLTMYVNSDRSFDYDMLREDIKTFARFLENINEFTEMIPLPAYRWAVENIRQYGMGFNGIGSTLFMLGHAYNSKEAEEFLHKIHFLRDDETLRASALLAKERGPFPMFSQEYLETPYFTQYCKASEDAKDLARKYGVRNAKRLTNPPLGNTSVICNNISNGIEPVFSFGYERTVMSDAWPEGMTAENVRDILPETKVGDATVWRGEYNGRTWYYEPHNRGLCFIEPIQDFGYRWVLEHYPEDIENNAEYLQTAQSLSVMDHVKVQAICQEYCDQSISKTASVPNEYPFEDFKQLYMQAWKSGLVGFTTYRSGTMEEVLSVGGKKAAASLSYLDALKEAGCINDDAELTDEQVIVKNVKLPEEFDNGETYIVKREGNKYYIHFSYLKNYKEHPIALWIYSNSLQDGEYVSLNRATRSLQRLLIEKGVDVDLVLEQVEKNKDNPHHERLGKMVGMALRHNLSMQDIAHALEGIEGDYISSTLTAVRKFLKKHIKDGTKAGKVCLACESDQVIYEGGCDRCLSCGNSGCA